VDENDEVARIAAMRAAEDDLRERDEREALRRARHGRIQLPGAFMEHMEQEEQEAKRRRLARRRAENAMLGGLGAEQEEYAEYEIELENYRGTVKEWVQQEPVKVQIQNTFKQFLRTYTDTDGHLKYPNLITTMCTGPWMSPQPVTALISMHPWIGSIGHVSIPYHSSLASFSLSLLRNSFFLSLVQVIVKAWRCLSRT